MAGRRKRLFILGAGFSKAVSVAMPLMSDLGEFVRLRLRSLPAYNGSRATYRRFLPRANPDVELLLSYLQASSLWVGAAMPA